MILQWLTPVRVGGGAFVVLSGAPAFAAVVWTRSVGGGTLTPTDSHADAAGIASAAYSAVGTTAGDTITVEVAVYA